MDEIGRFRELPLNVEVEIDQRSMTLRQVLELKTGSIIGLKKSAGENLDVLVGGARIATGEIVVLDNTLAIRITNLEKLSPSALP